MSDNASQWLHDLLDVHRKECSLGAELTRCKFALVPSELQAILDREGSLIATARRSLSPLGLPTTESTAELRHQKQVAANARFAKVGRAGTRVVRSAESAPVSYANVPDDRLPRPWGTDEAEREQK